MFKSCYSRLAAVLLALNCATPALAASFGQLQVSSALNEPLRASLDIHQLPAEWQQQGDLRALILPATHYARLGLTKPAFPLADLSSKIIPLQDESARLHLSSSQALPLSRLDVLVQLHGAGIEPPPTLHLRVRPLPPPVATSNADTPGRIEDIDVAPWVWLGVLLLPLLATVMLFQRLTEHRRPAHDLRSLDLSPFVWSDQTEPEGTGLDNWYARPAPESGSSRPLLTTEIDHAPLGDGDDAEATTISFAASAASTPPAPTEQASGRAAADTPTPLPTQAGSPLRDQAHRDGQPVSLDEPADEYARLYDNLDDFKPLIQELETAPTDSAATASPDTTDADRLRLAELAVDLSSKGDQHNADWLLRQLQNNLMASAEELSALLPGNAEADQSDHA